MIDVLKSDTPLEGEIAAPELLAGQRAELALCLVDVLSLPSGKLNDNERAFTADMLSSLLDEVSDEVKREVSERLANSMMPPTALLRRLLLENTDIAAPLLEGLKDIPEPQLAEVARQSALHRAAILRRVRISDVVADAILESGDVDTVLCVLMRQEVELSLPRVDELVARSMTEKSLRSALMQRQELQPQHGFTMFWWLDETDRKRILGRFAIDRTLIQNSLKSFYCKVFPQKDPDPVMKRILTLCDRRHRPRGKDGEAVSMDVVERMLTAVRANPTPDLCAATGLLAGVTPATASRVLLDEGGEPFSILCKSIGLSRSAYNDVLAKVALIRKPDAIGPAFDSEAQERLLATFDMIARDYSRTILRYWDWRRLG